MKSLFLVICTSDEKKNQSKSLICATSDCFIDKLRAKQILACGVVSCCIILYWGIDMTVGTGGSPKN